MFLCMFCLQKKVLVIHSLLCHCDLCCPDYPVSPEAGVSPVILKFVKMVHCVPASQCYLFHFLNQLDKFEDDLCFTLQDQELG